MKRHLNQRERLTSFFQFTCLRRGRSYPLQRLFCPSFGLIWIMSSVSSFPHRIFHSGLIMMFLSPARFDFLLWLRVQS